MVIDGGAEYIILAILILDLLISRLQVAKWHKRRKKGKIFYKYTSYLMSLLRISVIIACCVELFLLKNGEIILLLSLIGLLILIIVPIIKSYVSKALGIYWSKHIEIIEGQQLCISGPYKLVRHPSYTMNILELIGISLVTNSWYTLIFVSVLATLIYGIRIKLEERCLIKFLGNEYIRYKKNVGMVCPKIKLLKDGDLKYFF